MTAVRGTLLAGAVAAALLAAAFVSAGLAPLLPSIAAAALFALFPAAALVQGRFASGIDLRPHRVEVYASSTVLLFVVGFAVLWLADGLAVRPDLWLSLGQSPDAAAGTRSPTPRLAPLAPSVLLLAASCALTVGGVAILYVFRALSRALGWRESPVVSQIIPETAKEKATFCFLSLAAGFSEEVVFRGFLPAFLLPSLGSYALAVVPGCVIFGLMHAYQGAHGMVRAGALGLWLAVGVLWTGSLWPSIVAHAILDLLAGLWLSRSLLDIAPTHGSPKSPGPPSPETK